MVLSLCVRVFYCLLRQPPCRLPHHLATSAPTPSCFAACRVRCLWGRDESPRCHALLPALPGDYCRLAVCLAFHAGALRFSLSTLRQQRRPAAEGMPSPIAAAMTSSAPTTPTTPPTPATPTSPPTLPPGRPSTLKSPPPLRPSPPPLPASPPLPQRKPRGAPAPPQTAKPKLGGKPQLPRAGSKPRIVRKPPSDVEHPAVTSARSKLARGVITEEELAQIMRAHVVSVERRLSVQHPASAPPQATAPLASDASTPPPLLPSTPPPLPRRPPPKLPSAPAGTAAAAAALDFPSTPVPSTPPPLPPAPHRAGVPLALKTPQIIVVSGAVGVGKTCLLRRVYKEAQELDWVDNGPPRR